LWPCRTAVRIQTGYGLEGAIPDAYAARIIDKAIVPRFRDGDLDQGVLDGTKIGGRADRWRGPAGIGSAIDAQRAAGRLAQRGLGGCTDAAGRLPCGSVALTALGAGAPGAIAGLGPPAAGDGRGGRGPAGGGHVGATPGTGSVCIVLALCVPVASLLGWCWRRSRGVRVVLLGMLGVSSGFSW
jgi:uncharacterized protein